MPNNIMCVTHIIYEDTGRTFVIKESARNAGGGYPSTRICIYVYMYICTHTDLHTDTRALSQKHTHTHLRMSRLDRMPGADIDFANMYSLCAFGKLRQKIPLPDPTFVSKVQLVPEQGGISGYAYRIETNSSWNLLATA